LLQLIKTIIENLLWNAIDLDLDLINLKKVVSLHVRWSSLLLRCDEPWEANHEIVVENTRTQSQAR